LGENIAYAFARKGNLWWLLIFSFSLGMGTTVAEPALIAVADEAAKVAPLSVVLLSRRKPLNRVMLMAYV